MIASSSGVEMLPSSSGVEMLPSSRLSKPTRPHPLARRQTKSTTRIGHFFSMSIPRYILTGRLILYAMRCHPHLLRTPGCAQVLSKYTTSPRTGIRTCCAATRAILLDCAFDANPQSASIAMDLRALLSTCWLWPNLGRRQRRKCRRNRCKDSR